MLPTVPIQPMAAAIMAFVLDVSYRPTVGPTSSMVRRSRLVQLHDR